MSIDDVLTLLLLVIAAVELGIHIGGLSLIHISEPTRH